MKLTYHIKGLRPLMAKFMTAPEKKQRELDQELNRSSLRVEKRAKEYAPWDTGWLSNNIYSAQISRLNYEVVSPVHYSIYLELGTRKMAAQPFMFPAMQDEYPQLMKNVSNIFSKL